MNIDSCQTFRSLKEASKHAKVSRQAIFYAIQKGRLKAEKKGKCWTISRQDLNNYRANKYTYDYKKVNNVHLFDAEKGFFSIQQVAKVIGDALSGPYPRGRIYYLIRRNQLDAEKVGKSWVITKKNAVALMESELRLQQSF